MTISFEKYHGAGNDFVMLDNRGGRYNDLTEAQINFLCHRHFGIGGDGLLMVNNHDKYDFEMRYYNADGRLGSMCGNGGRCIVAYAHSLGIIKDRTLFLASDGEHEAILHSESDISLKMIDIEGVTRYDEHNFFLNTGSPHHVRFCENLDDVNVFQIGKDLRYGPLYNEKGGANINFVKINAPDSLTVYTYERGVEDETLACGTGITASVLAYSEDNNFAKNKQHSVKVKAKGGLLEVTFLSPDHGKFENVWLRGPAKGVFKGLL